MPRRNLFLNTLDEDDLAYLRPHLRPVLLPAGDVLFEPGDVVPIVYFPHDAVISLFTVLADGRSAPSATIGYETGVELLSALTGSESTGRVVVQISGEGVALPASVLRDRMADSASLVTRILANANASACRCAEALASNTLGSVGERLARCLLVTADRTGAVSFRITQEGLADILAVQRTTVTAAASKLKGRGMIAYQRGQLTILDRDGLVALAGPHYHPLCTWGQRRGHANKSSV
ncbi:MAG: Crp/Fnr family transcriptional regulator [Pseudomonadota bacterium]